MNILGFTYSYGCHDTSAAIVCDGVLVAAVEEERFTRKKHDSSFPFHAIEYCLRRAGIKMSQVDYIAFPGMPFRTGSDSGLAGTDLEVLTRLNSEGKVRFRSLVHKRILDLSLGLGLRFNWQMDPTVSAGFAGLAKRYSLVPPIRYFDHHLCHAAAAYFTSGYDRASIATIDGRGAAYASVTWDASNGKISRLRSEPYTNSLGIFYWDCTHYLGLGDFAEGKTMGLAAYGDKTAYAETTSRMLNTSDYPWYRYQRKPDLALLGFEPRVAERITSHPYPDFAAASQAALERAVERVVMSAVNGGGRPLCLGGGVALNCSSNGRLRDSGLAPCVWVFPASGDAGLSVGAALLSACESGDFRVGSISSPYLGPDFAERECETSLASSPMLAYTRSADIASEVSTCLAAGQTVGFFQGRTELGPRALGNRSILADPRTVAMRDRVNQIKGREKWRPLAPVILAERASEYFTNSQPSPFMLFATNVHPGKRAMIPAVVHVDGSARPQTVTRDQNPVLYDLISQFYRLTGVPVLLNTSFNTASEPMVCTPADAIKTFLTTGLDVLVLGNFVARRQAGAAPRSSNSLQE